MKGSRMSDENPLAADYLTNVGTDVNEFRKKQREVQQFEVDNRHDDMIRRKEELAVHESIDPTKMSPEKIKSIQKSSTNYLTGAKNSKPFLMDEFRGKIPYFSQNLIVLAAETGQGKSTIAANLAFHALLQGQKVLIVTNEENPSDCYNRVTCLTRGWPYNNHEDFTDEQIQFFDENIPRLAQRMVVIDDFHSGAMGQTTTLEGIKAIFDPLVEKGHDYDIIVLDYYQNVAISSKNPKLNDWQVQDLFVKYINQVKNVIGCPLITVAQKKKAKKDEELSFKELIEGRKTISNAATCVVELKVNKKELSTTFKIVKSRFANAVGEEIKVGFDKGKYVRHTPEFAAQVLARNERKQMSDVHKLGSIFDKEKDDEKTE